MERDSAPVRHLDSVGMPPPAREGGRSGPGHQETLVSFVDGLDADNFVMHPVRQITFGLTLLVAGCRESTPVGSTPAANPAVRREMTPQTAAALAKLESRERAVDASVWKPEMQAIRHGKVIDEWWDLIKQATNRLDAALQLPIPRLTVPEFVEVRDLPPMPAGIIRQRAARESPVDAMAWQDWVRQWLRQGWILDRVEARQVAFDPPSAQSPARSVFEVRLHARRPEVVRRVEISGRVRIEWGESGKHEPYAKSLNLDQLECRGRVGMPGFELQWHHDLATAENRSNADPLLVFDLDGDQQPEISLAGANLVFRNRGNFVFESGTLVDKPGGEIYNALIEDFTGDGIHDVVTQGFQGVWLHAGLPGGGFSSSARTVWKSSPEIRHPQAIASGDMDGDGDLDLFLGQYRNPYEEGRMPTPFHDSRDGFPFHILRNDGAGLFSDRGDYSDFGSKRYRRVYSASFVHLDSDDHMDLLVISDFAGGDVYRGLGNGRFLDVTDQWLSESHAFGMGHSFGDFNADGFLDWILIGMTSPTVDRLEHLGLFRRDGDRGPSFRKAMVSGNRMYFGSERGGEYRLDTLGASAARTGWAWGSAMLDVDNDGWEDLYVANGHETRRTVDDYEGEYWRHDLFVGRSEADPFAHEYFKASIGRSRASEQSYGGNECNRLLLNWQGREFIEAGYLMGVAIPEDSRNVVVSDLDGDGRQDLVVVGYEAWPGHRQWMRIFRNTLQTSNQWSTVWIPQAKPGTRLRIEHPTRRKDMIWTTGDGYRSQRPPEYHIGWGGFSEGSVQAAIGGGRETQRVSLVPGRRVLTIPSIHPRP